jgi:hypothetical protein
VSASITTPSRCRIVGVGVVGRGAGVVEDGAAGSVAVGDPQAAAVINSPSDVTDTPRMSVAGSLLSDELGHE